MASSSPRSSEVRRVATRLALAWMVGAVPLAQALEPKEPVLVSRNYATQGASWGLCIAPRFSANARHLTFGCLADDLVPGDDNERDDTFVLDRHSGVIERVSVDNDGQEARYASAAGIPSDDGREVVFPSNGPLHPDVLPFVANQQTLGRANVFLRRRDAGATDLVSRDLAGGGLFRSTQLFGGDHSRDEALIASFQDLFDSGNTDLHPKHLYIRNWRTGELELISAGSHGGYANAGMSYGVLSPDGGYVVFGSWASDIDGETQGFTNLFLRNRQTGTSHRLTYPWHGGEFSSSTSLNYVPSVSRNARHVAFASSSTEFRPDPAHPFLQVYVLDRDADALELVSQSTTGEPGDSFSGAPSISADGRYIAFYSRASNLPGGGPTPAIYVVDRHTGEWANVTAPLGGQLRINTPYLDLAQDGSALAFDWWASNPELPPDQIGRQLIYTVELGTAVARAPAQPVPSLRSWSLVLLVGMVLLIVARVRIRNVATSPLPGA